MYIITTLLRGAASTAVSGRADTQSFKTLTSAHQRLSRWSNSWRTRARDVITVQHSLPTPKDWQDFEGKTRVLFACVLKDPNTEMHGRTGQPRHGVDICGHRRRKLQQRARELTEDLSRTERPIFVVVWGWQDVEEQAAEQYRTHRAFDPTFNPYVEHLGESLLAEFARNKGVPPEPLRAILEKLDEVGVRDYEIPLRFNAQGR
jgi:hypothetical protein